jgi:MFS family permease
VGEGSALGVEAETSPTGLGREFRLFATGQAVSVVGDRLATIALVFLVLHLSHSYPPAVGLFYVCQVIPTLTTGLLVGVLVDHFDRRRLMVGCDLGRAVLVGSVPILSTIGLWSLYPAVVVLYFLTLVFDTAALAAIPDVVPEQRMLSANAILNSIGTAADFAYAAGGLIIFWFGLQVPFYVDALTFLFSAGMVAAMRIPRQQLGPLPNVGDVARRIRQGIAYLMEQPFLKWSTATFALAPLAGGIIYVITPLYANYTLSRSRGLFGPLQSGAFRFGMLEVALGGGALLGSWLVPRLAAHWPRGRVFGLGILGYGLAAGIMAVVDSFYVAAGIIFLLGIFNSLFVVAGMTLLQTLTPTEVRGRVVAARFFVINVALAIGAALGGPFLVVVPYSMAWFIAGAIISLSSLFVWLRPEVRSQP